MRHDSSDVPPLSPQDTWASERVEAILGLYKFSEPGSKALRDIRVHHVLGRPGWFGSTGHGNWVGIGTARPRPIMHELAHSFWGAFPVFGRPDLDWKHRPDRSTSSGIQALRNDLERFLAEPPDLFEPLRDRLRRIPDLISGSSLPGLYHLGEASIVPFTGGNLNLVPPILRKYYGAWLEPGDFATWDEAAAWYLNLTPEDRALAGEYFPVGELSVEAFPRPDTTTSRLSSHVLAILKSERRQRLVDFVEQYNLLFRDLDGTGAPTNDFRFWRNYVSGLVSDFEKDPEAIKRSNHRERRLKDSLAFLASLRKQPLEDQVASAQSHVLSDQFFTPFIGTLDHRVLAALVRGHRSLDEQAAARLARQALEPTHLKFLEAAADLFELGASDLPEAQAAFDWFLRGIEKWELQSMNFLLEVMGTIDREATRNLLLGLSPEIALSVMNHGPAFTRFLLEPEELITVLGFGGELDPDQLSILAFMFSNKVSATPSIDEPFQDAVYQRILELGNHDPQRALQIFIQSGLWVEPFLRLRPEGAVNLIQRDLKMAARVFTRANPVRLPPARAIYRLLQVHPESAAALTLEFERQDRRDVVKGALLYFAYDAHRQRTQPGLTISLANDVRYLHALAGRAGQDWLDTTVTEAIGEFKQLAARGNANPDLLLHYHDTLVSAMEMLGEGDRAALDTASLILETLPEFGPM